MKKGNTLLIICILLCACWGAALAEGGLKPGDSGSEVLELNTRLRQLNYTAVRAGELYGDATAAAVCAVQAAYGLPETGIADEEVLSIIYGECYRPLSYGATGEDVRQLQEKLAELGYYNGNITGSYLEGTTAAVQIFQGENSMEINGTADVKTQQKLFSLAIRPTPTPTPVPTASPVPTPSPTPGPYEAFRKKLTYGSTGADVQKVQQRLKDLGYFTYWKTTTGYYKNTQAAVEAFQAQNGLEVTGDVNESTWNALFNDTSVVDVYSEPKPAYEPTPLPYFFEVDVKNQVVKVWTYNRDTKDYTDLDRAFICTTGSKTYPTTPGTYTLTGRKSAMCWFPDWGGGEARWWVRIGRDKNGTFAFHSVLYSQWDNDSTLKVSSFTGLGKRGSHGCIRLTVADAKWVYDHAEAGMQVWVHEDGPDDPELRNIVKPGELNRKTMMPAVTPAPPQYTYDGTSAPLTAERSLKVGSEGQDVYWLQMKLKELGFYTGTVTGQYREGTKNAVSAYQRSRGLDNSGTANVKTLETLYSEVREANRTPEPTLAPGGQTPSPD